MKRSPTREATSVHTPINLPSWGPLAQLREMYRFRHESRPLVVANAEHADAYKLLPIVEADELAATATLRNPGDRHLRGFIPKT